MKGAQWIELVKDTTERKLGQKIHKCKLCKAECGKAFKAGGGVGHGYSYFSPTLLLKCLERIGFRSMHRDIFFCTREMQRNTNVLKSLICALLHLDPDDVLSVTILNPIELGETIDDKNYILDIKVELNEHTITNLELQVVNEGNWPERSLCYLCRVFDNLNRGEDYEDVRPAIQIGLLDFTLFEDSPEFFANYYLMNQKNHRIYSDKFRLSVLDLTQIDLATKEDRAYRIDRWAALFKATTWEELKMLAKNNQSIEDAVTTVRQLTQEEKIRQQCEAREDYYRRTAGREKRLKKVTGERDELKEQLSQKDAEIAKKDAEIAKNKAEIERLRNLLANRNNSEK